ncbi:uncharacterized protein [Triticum aestivum]|uniref:uncharacterized protein isoform X4 n=1 Tax=Triticum aestivum TaxID=4565 RepID=UPI001D02BC8F|nr:uncharacterized protein LOC123040708 isoform X4 [Triticum aestivum]
MYLWFWLVGFVEGFWLVRQSKKGTAVCLRLGEGEKEEACRGVSGPEIRRVVFTDAAWKPGRENTTGIEISIQFAKEQQHVNISILVSEEPIISPLQAEAMALQVAAQVVIAITTGNIMFFTDNQVLAQAAQARDILKIPGHWQIRNQLANFFATTSRTQIAVHHIPRKLNDRAHNNARKAYSLQCNISPVMTCNSRSHLVEHCPYASEARQSKHQQL